MAVWLLQTLDCRLPREEWEDSRVSPSPFVSCFLSGTPRPSWNLLSIIGWYPGQCLADALLYPLFGGFLTLQAEVPGHREVTGGCGADMGNVEVLDGWIYNG